ncbi:MAG: hypothetical protein ACRDRJ_25710 [Streptosporangiaceae bacterium]
MPRTPTGRAAQDRGTRYAAALAQKGGTTRDEQQMAALCEYVIQVQAPGLNPRLVWEGAQAARVTCAQLKKLVQQRKWGQVEEFMWAAMERQ